MAELTPMMQQYMQTKKEYPDCILFYRLGDFYEMFFDDAIVASKELEIALTGKSCGLEERAPMCGIPYHAVETYLARHGKGAATSILDQIEKLIVSQFRIAHQRGDLRVLRNSTNRLQRLEHLRHFISAGLTFLKGLHEARGVGARNRRKFSHNQSFAFNCSSN